MKRKPVAVVAVVVTLIAALGVVLVVRSVGESLRLPALGPECTVRADGVVTLDAVQMANAATITAVGARRRMPERAVVVALATAFQESKLENLESGDRDSLGLFQQRPSQGWGRPEQIRDPRYAADRFYSALKRVKGWQDMRVTDAAQRVQRSAYPELYEQWADESAVLARALLGRATGAVACTLRGEPSVRGTGAVQALTQALRRDWGRGMGAVAPQAAGLTVAAADPGAGWRYAHWLVAHARDTGLETVRFAGQEWRAPTGSWQPVEGGGDSAAVVAGVFR